MLKPQDLAELVRRKLNSRFVVVSHQQPLIPERQNCELVYQQHPAGLASALDAVMRATGGLWVSRGNGDARADARGRVEIPAGGQGYTLKRVWIERDLDKQYYEGLVKQALWPLCHTVFRRPVFDREHWRAYQCVNRIFADAIAAEIGHEDTFVFIQDYHLAPLAHLLKERCPNVRTAHFWHIPWPSPDIFGVFPWRNELVADLLDNGLIGFQLAEHAANFVSTAARFLGAACSGERISHVGHDTHIRAFPVGIDSERLETLVRSPEVAQQTSALRAELNLGSSFVVVSVDRFDCSKGIPERLRAIDLLLETRPEYRGRLVFVQVAAPSRTTVPGYQVEENYAVQLAAEINRKYGRQGWQPVELLRESLPLERVSALYRLADVCVAGSLHEGMNLEAKEFVASRVEGNGALVLSSFAGAAQELKEAILVNPFCVEEFADAIAFALQMSADEAQLRMWRMRERLARNSVYDWAGAIIEMFCQVTGPARVSRAEALARHDPLHAMLPSNGRSAHA